VLKQTNACLIDSRCDGEVLSVFEKCYKSIVLPAASDLDILDQKNRDRCNSGRGPYDSEDAAYCYCLCYAPMHYESYKSALKLRFGKNPNLPVG
jgi:hypothetical protein